MNNFYIIFTLVISLFFTSCNESTDTSEVQTETQKTTDAYLSFANLDFTSSNKTTKAIERFSFDEIDFISVQVRNSSNQIISENNISHESLNFTINNLPINETLIFIANAFKVENNQTNAVLTGSATKILSLNLSENLVSINLNSVDDIFIDALPTITSIQKETSLGYTNETNISFQIFNKSLSNLNWSILKNEALDINFTDVNNNNQVVESGVISFENGIPVKTLTLTMIGNLPDENLTNFFKVTNPITGDSVSRIFQLFQKTSSISLNFAPLIESINILELTDKIQLEAVLSDVISDISDIQFYWWSESENITVENNDTNITIISSNLNDVIQGIVGLRVKSISTNLDSNYSISLDMNQLDDIVLSEYFYSTIYTEIIDEVGYLTVLANSDFYENLDSKFLFKTSIYGEELNISLNGGFDFSQNYDETFSTNLIFKVYPFDSDKYTQYLIVKNIDEINGTNSAGTSDDNSILEFNTTIDLNSTSSNDESTTVSSFKFLNITQSFTRDDTNEIVTDEVFGLKWEDTAHVKTNTYTFSSAESYCSNLTLGGITDWRVPTKKELWYLYDRSKYAPALNSTFENYTTGWSDYTWTSTVYQPSTSNNWTVITCYGFDNYYSRTDSNYMRCVSGTSDYEFEDNEFERDNSTNIVTDKRHNLMWQDNSS